MKTKLKRLKTIAELTSLATTDDSYLELLKATVQNLGCDHLKGSHGSEAQQWSQAIEQYWNSLVSEYNIREDLAEREILGEANGLRDLIQARSK
jgi:spore coat polysaccharide biosynthesis protein SpsF (cytidylyltransferase family)